MLGACLFVAFETARAAAACLRRRAFLPDCLCAGASECKTGSRGEEATRTFIAYVSGMLTPDSGGDHRCSGMLAAPHGIIYVTACRVLPDDRMEFTLTATDAESHAFRISF